MSNNKITVNIPYGSQMQEVSIPDDQLVGTYLPKKIPTAQDPKELLRESIKKGIETCGIGEKAKPGAKVCIAITDRTRLTPNLIIVPLLLDLLNAYGISDKDINIIVGLGMHDKDNPEAILKNVGQDVVDRVTVINNEPDNEKVMVHLGETPFGTPVELHQRFAEADIKIGTGNVTPCILSGWSGGGKIVLPGVASRKCIYENHKRFTRILAKLQCASLMGIMPPQNEVRADIEESAAISGIDMVVNTLLDVEGNIVMAYSGEPVAVHRAAVEKMRPYVEVSVPHVDVMVTGVGESGFEVSLFQGGSRVCGGVDRYLKEGGTLIMANECREGIYEGFEHAQYREWMKKMPTPARIREHTENMEIGPEKSCVLHTFSWLIHEKKCRIQIVTDNMTKEELKEVHLEHAPNVQEALDEALDRYGNGASVAVMPYAALVLPK
jgi:nickel-dependent lactate racemase